MLTALTFRQSAGVISWCCILVHCGLWSMAWGKSLSEAHDRAMDLLRAMETTKE